MKRRVVLLICLLFGCSVLYAQQYAGNYQSGFTKKGNSFYFSASNGKSIIEFCTASMFRVRQSRTGNFEANEPWMVVNYNWQPVQVTSADKGNHFLLTTADIQVKVYKAPFRVDVLDKKGAVVSSDKGGMYSHADTVGCEKKLSADEHFFGFGERMDFIDQRNKKVKLNVGRGKGMPHITGAYNILEANYSPIPFFMSTKGYGIFFHNAFPTTWDMGMTSPYKINFSAAGGELDYYFIYGPGFPAIVNQYTSLTGKSPLLPRFALGLHVGTYSGGTWGYEQLTSDKYVIELARKLREMGVPVDILWLDSTWRIFGKVGGKGATSFEWRETFGNPRAMFDSLYAMQYKMVGLHLRPRFDNGNTLKLLDTARQLGYTYPENNKPGEFVNYFDSASVDWWWKHGVMRVASLGAKFLKTDEGSAFGGLANESDKTGPTGTEIARLHNIFPIAYARAPYEKFQQYNGIRGLNHTREGYAGIQRYPFIFAGDWPSEWQYFAPVIKAGLNLGLSGVGYWTHCMGGFEHDADPELYVRWCQFGMLSSLAMVFGMDHPGYKEPWNYGADGFRNFKKYDSLRYTLLPYLYSNAWNMYKTGLPLMQALVLQYQDDPNVYDIGDQYLLGSSLMICPVTTKGAQTRSVYLPEGTWFDYWTGKSYAGKQYIHVVTPLDVLPIFVKAGSIIPVQPAMRYTGEQKVEVLTLDIYPGAAASFELYEDDETSLTYQQGNFAVTQITTASSSTGLTVTIKKPTGKFVPAAHRYLIKLHVAMSPQRVLENGSEVKWNYNGKEQVLYVQTTAGNDRDIVIEMENTALSFSQELSTIGLGWAANTVNTVVFRRNSVVSDKQWQYAAYYDTTGHVVIAKRRLGQANWEVKQTAYTGNIKDAHNCISIMVDGDGYLHLSWDHHNNPLNYCKSVAPGSLELTSKLPMTGKEESSVTYPEFYRMPNGDLLLLYRDGSSGRGNLVLNRYYTQTKKWERMQSNLIDGERQRSPYWQACVDAKGTFHISWVWRESPDVASNHDLCYAQSADGGKTWKQSGGKEQPIPMNAANADYVVRIPQRSDLINSTSMSTNSAGHPYIATYWKPAGAVSPQYHLVYYDGKLWQVKQVSNRTDNFSLSGQGTRRIPISRPQVLVNGNKVWLFFRDAARGNAVSVSYTGNLFNDSWKTIDLLKQSVGQWEPSYDTELWQRKKIVNLFVQYTGQGDGERTEQIAAQAVNILEWKPR